MTKVIGRIAVVAIAVAGIGMVTPRTVHAASDTANATANIIAPITITQTGDLDFASIVPDVAPQTVVVNTANTRTACTGGLVCTGAVSSASFDVGGAAGAGYTITLPGTLNITDGGVNNMNVDTWTINPTSPATLSGSPPDTLTVGATLNVNANQVAGSYGQVAETFTLTVDYQ